MFLSYIINNKLFNNILRRNYHITTYDESIYTIYILKTNMLYYFVFYREYDVLAFVHTIEMCV